MWGFIRFPLNYTQFKPKVESLYLLCNPFIYYNPIITTMGFLDKLRRKKDETVEKVKEQTTPQPTDPTNAPPPPGRKVKRYTSEGKPVYE